jgi:hypothetical protein
LLYGFEGLDSEGSAEVELAEEPEIQAQRRPELLGGVTILKGKTAQGKTFQAVPFYALANRGKSSQQVWVRKQKYLRSERWWLGELYRPIGNR